MRDKRYPRLSLGADVDRRAGRLLLAVRAIRPDALGIQIHRVSYNLEPPLFGNAFLSPLDFFVVELFDVSAMGADEMVVVLHRLAFESRRA